MLVTCKYCGKMHDRMFECPKKPKREFKGRKYSKNTEQDKIRGSIKWQKLRNYVRVRDNDICQLCFRNFPGTRDMINCNGLEAHHIIPLAENTDFAFDSDNVILLCKRHHEAAEAGIIERETLREICNEQELRMDGKTCETS